MRSPRNSLSLHFILLGAAVVFTLGVPLRNWTISPASAAQPDRVNVGERFTGQNFRSAVGDNLT